jgi:hypothetical protein
MVHVYFVLYIKRREMKIIRCLDFQVLEEEIVYIFSGSLVGVGSF